MYTLVRSLCLGNSIGAQWETPNLSAAFLTSVYKAYKKIYLTLSHPSVTELLHVDMNVLRGDISGFTGTVSQWLTSIGSRTLPMIDSLPDGRMRYAKFANAVQAGYLLDQAVAGMNYDANYPLLSKTDIRMRRPQYGTQMKLLETHCLVTVNGFIHDTVATDTEAFVLGGATTGRMGNDNHVGIYSFVDIGKLTKVKLNPLKIVPMENGTTLMEKIRFSVDEDLTGKSFFLVLGGYLVMPKANVFFQTAAKSFSLNLNMLPYIERLLESYTLLNLTSMGMIPPNHAPGGFDLSQMRSDEKIRKYMTLPQSFLVIVDTEQLHSEQRVIQRAAFPGQFICREDPVYPVIGGHGKFFEFWKQEEQGKWVVNTRDTYYRRYIYSEGPRNDANFTSSALDTTRSYDHSQAFLLEISAIKGNT